MVSYKFFFLVDLISELAELQSELLGFAVDYGIQNTRLDEVSLEFELFIGLFSLLSSGAFLVVDWSLDEEESCHRLREELTIIFAALADD